MSADGLLTSRVRAVALTVLVLCIPICIVLAIDVRGGDENPGPAGAPSQALEHVLEADLNGLGDFRLSRNGEFLAYLVETGEPDSNDRRGQVGLFSVAQRRLLWSWESKDPTLQLASGVAFGETDHYVLCAYTKSGLKREDAQQPGQVRSGYLVLDSTGRIDRDVVVPAEDGAREGMYTAIPVFADLLHVVTIRPDLEGLSAVRIFDRQGQLAGKIVGREKGWTFSSVKVSPDGTYLAVSDKEGVAAFKMDGQLLWRFQAQLPQSGRGMTRDGQFICLDGGDWLVSSKLSPDSWKRAGGTEKRYSYETTVDGVAILDRWGNPVWGSATVGVRGAGVRGFPLGRDASVRRDKVDWAIDEMHLGGDRTSVTLVTWVGRSRQLYHTAVGGPPSTGAGQESGDSGQGETLVVKLPDACSERERICVSADGSRAVISKPAGPAPETANEGLIDVYSRTGKHIASGTVLVNYKRYIDSPIPPYIWKLEVSDDGRYVAALAGSVLHVFRVP